MTDNPAGAALAQTDQAAGQRDLAWLAKNPSFWTIEAARSAAGADPLAQIEVAELRIQGELQPVPADPAVRDEWRGALDERLRRLGVKVSPGMSVEQAKEWRDVMIEALSDLPALIVLTAARRAIHRTFRFLNEVDPAVREISADLVAARKVALNKLADFRRSLTATCTPLLSDDTDRPLSAAEIRALSPEFRRMGLAKSWLTQSDIDAAEAESVDQAA